ncbi:hypothetical protein B0A49_04034 [Cryomyces minteri]|uniref:Uncharacterized protein n=1 Tax=Cryomyces minteri TaxID=331657 RepID=A0A4U0XEN4_9PEZI|nr:hypothetical protein B0A49_04034 [Cryomyces minteri]
MCKEDPKARMLACQYMGPKNMVVNAVPKPMITAPKDAIRGHRLSRISGCTQLTDGHPGNQAEFCRVPDADVVLVRAPKSGISPEKLLALADVTTAAWHGCELAEVGKGDVAGVRGCDPVGLSTCGRTGVREHDENGGEKERGLERIGSAEGQVWSEAWQALLL